MSKRLSVKSSLRIGLLFLFVGLFIYYYIQNRDAFQSLLGISPVLLTFIGVMQFVVILTNTVFLKIFIRVYGKSARWPELLLVTLRSSVINFFGFLQGGIGYRAYYLKRQHDIAYRDFSGLLLANYWAIFLVSSVFGLFGIIIQGPITSSFSSIVLATLFFSSTIVLLAMSRLPKLVRSLAQRAHIERFVDAIQQLQDNRRMGGYFIATALIQFTVSTLVFFLTIFAVGATPSFGGILVYSAVAQFSVLIALTPSAIGFREGLLILAQGSLGVDTSVIILSATVERLVYFIILAILSVTTSPPIRAILKPAR